MRDSEFCYWLNGYVELTNGQRPDETQWLVIMDHLKSVFQKETPQRFPVQPSKEPEYCKVGTFPTFSETRIC